MIYEHGGCCTDTAIFTCLYGSAHGHKKCDLKACYESYDALGDYLWLPLNPKYDHRVTSTWPGKITEAILMSMDEFIELFKTYSLWWMGSVEKGNRVVGYDVDKEIDLAWYFKQGAFCMKTLFAARDAMIEQIRQASEESEEREEIDDEYMNEEQAQELARLYANRPSVGARSGVMGIEH